jgi:hypothetical protein
VSTNGGTKNNYDMPSYRSRRRRSRRSNRSYKKRRRSRRAYVTVSRGGIRL